MAKPSAENEPTELDELTHLEFRTMHQNASTAILFAKFIQWSAVGMTLIIFSAAIFVDRLMPPGHALENLLLVAIILFTSGAIFLLFMYQMWQFNEIKRIRQIERYFSTFCRQVNNIESRREKNVERYTMLLLMIAAVLSSAVITALAIR